MSDLRAALERALNNQPKDTTMQNPPIADLKTTINQWVKDDTQEPDTKTTLNVSRETFNAVRDNPNKTRDELIAILTTKGCNPSSVSSLLGQMVKQRLVVRSEDGTHHTPYTEYVPLKATPKTSTKKKKVTITKRAYVRSGKYAAKSGIAALGAHTTSPKQTPVTPTPTPVAAAPVKPVAFDAEALLSTLSFPQVLALYKKIKLLLGEAS